MRTRAQGATEYLVLLAVVLIVALVSVALLGFFPGMASDAQETQSQTYWKGAQPISIVESAVKYQAYGNPPYDNFPYLKLRNSGSYPIRITKLVGGDGATLSIFYCSPGQCAPGAVSGGNSNISDFFYMAPGEEKYFSEWQTKAPEFNVRITKNAGSNLYVGGADSTCGDSSTPTTATTSIRNFGFEYIEYLDNNQQITKREIGAKPLVMRCM